MSLDRSELQIEDSTETALQSREESILPIEHEIDCPRCHDIMMLSAQFDRLCYLCEECSFSLYLSH
jgi:late competence protein required for DNA uptake (superfamily II DNA/RNA helicase)